MADFHPNSMQQLGPGYSTPVLSGGVDQHPPVSTPYQVGQLGNGVAVQRHQLSLGAVSRLVGGDRIQGRVNFSDLPPSTQVVGATGMGPAVVPLPPGGTVVSVGDGQQGVQQVPANIQSQIDSHRASNQVENVVNDRPSGINITDLRRDDNLRQGVESYMDSVIRSRIPSLSSAQTAQVHGVMAGDGIRVTPVSSPYQTAPIPNVVVGDGIRVTPVSAPYQPPPSTTSAGLPTGYVGQQQVATAPAQAVYLSSDQQSQHHYQQQPSHTQPLPYQQQPQQPQQQFVQHVFSGTPQVQGLPVPSMSTSPGDPNSNYCYEWITDSSGSRILVRTPIHNPTVQQYGSLSRAQAPPLHQVPVQQVVPLPHQSQGFMYQPTRRPETVSYQTEFRCSPTSGRQWQVRVPVTNPPPQLAQPPQFRNEWRIHPQTGVSYQVQVQVSAHSPQTQTITPQPLLAQNIPQQPAPHQPPQQQVFQQSAYHQQFSQQPMPPTQQQQQVHQRFVPPHPTHLPTHQQPSSQAQQSFQQHTSAPGSGNMLVPDMSHAAQQSFTQYCEQDSNISRQERVAGIVSLLEGGTTTRKQSKIIDFAKKCPARWSKQATLSNINLPLYAWGSSLSGRPEAMQEGVMLGKLRHLQNILEVCCLSSSSTDFTGYGWTLARDYAAKVDNEVEQKLTNWQDMQAGVRTATLVSSQMEHPRPPPPPRETKKAWGGEKKDLCTTYNKCKTEGKCDYEVVNPGKTCQRKHECSHCREKKKQSWRHQAWNCQNKPADG